MIAAVSDLWMKIIPKGIRILVCYEIITILWFIYQVHAQIIHAKINNLYETVYGFLRIEHHLLLSTIRLGFSSRGYDVDDVIIICKWACRWTMVTMILIDFSHCFWRHLEPVRLIDTRFLYRTACRRERTERRGLVFWLVLRHTIPLSWRQTCRCPPDI